MVVWLLWAGGTVGPRRDQRHGWARTAERGQRGLVHGPQAIGLKPWSVTISSTDAAVHARPGAVMTLSLCAGAPGDRGPARDVPASSAGGPTPRGRRGRAGTEGPTRGIRTPARLASALGCLPGRGRERGRDGAVRPASSLRPDRPSWLWLVADSRGRSGRRDVPPTRPPLVHAPMIGGLLNAAGRGHRLPPSRSSRRRQAVSLSTGHGGHGTGSMGWAEDRRRAGVSGRYIGGVPAGAVALAGGRMPKTAMCGVSRARCWAGARFELRWPCRSDRDRGRRLLPPLRACGPAPAGDSEWADRLAIEGAGARDAQLGRGRRRR